MLQALVTRFTEKELKPCMAVELEFSLLPKPETSEAIGTALRDQNAVGGNLYALSELDYHGPLLEALRQAFDTQDLPYEGIIKESAPSQFEINVAHSDDVMLLADQVIRMQRTIRAVSARHGFVASFMPKPIDDEAGNGLHVHCSLLDENGTNVFDDGGEEGSDHYVTQLLDELLPASMLLFAPSFNAYRRFQPGNHAPTESAWGYDNRTTAIRIPESPAQPAALSIGWRGRRQPLSGISRRAGRDLARHREHTVTARPYRGKCLGSGDRCTCPTYHHG